MPATNSTNLDKMKAKAPSISGSLSELDPKRTMRPIEFLKSFQFTDFALNKWDSEQIFNFADVNRDWQLDWGEWGNFVGLYVLPFEACDSDKDNLLNEKEFTKCMKSDPKFQGIKFPSRMKGKEFASLLEAVTSRARPLINLNEYLFIRRLLYWWNSCKSNPEHMSRWAFGCALKTAIGFERKINFKITDDQIFDIGLQADNDYEIQHTFVSFARVAYNFYVFNLLSTWNNSDELEKVQMLRAIREDRFAHNIDEKEVNLWYDLINTNPFKKTSSMNFPTFSFFFWNHRLFNKYQNSKPHHLNEKEVLKMFKDSVAPGAILQAVDRSFSNFNEQEYMEASLSIHRLRPNEWAYFSSFLGIKENESEESQSYFSNTVGELLEERFLTWTLNRRRHEWSALTALSFNKTANVSVNDNVENASNRKVFFTMFSEANNHWSRASMYRAFSLWYLFMSMTPDGRFVIPVTQFVENLMQAYSKSVPPISIEQRENYHIYKTLSRDISIDVLTFLAIENYRYTLKWITRNSNVAVPESAMKTMLEKFWMRNMPDTVLDLWKVWTSISWERTFNKDVSMENCVFVQSIASEQKRSALYFKGANLKKNLDPSRWFPWGNNRHEASPWI